jgi:hypothetical protein
MLVLVGSRTLGLATKSEGNVDIESIEIARDLIGTAHAQAPPRTHVVHDRPPGLALVLALAAMLDGRVERGLSCGAADRDACRSGLFASVYVAQYLAAVAVFVMVLVMALRLSRAWDISLIALALSLIALRPADAAGLIRPMIWYQFLLALYLFLALIAHQNRSSGIALAAGTTIGLSMLFEPLAALLVPAAFLVCFLPSHEMREQPLYPALRAVAVLAGVALSVGLAATVLGHSYDVNGALRHVARQLAERSAFNGMDPTTWIAALILPTPLIGDWLQPVFGDAGSRVGAARAGSIRDRPERR